MYTKRREAIGIGRPCLVFVLLKFTRRSVEIPFEKLKQAASPFKGLPPVKLSGSGAPFFQGNSAALLKETGRCMLFAALAKNAAQYMCEQSLLFTLRPMSVRADKNYKKGDIQIALVTDSVSRIVFKKTGAAEEIKNGTAPMYVNPPACCKKDDFGQWPDGSLMAAWWWVRDVSDEEEANMIVKCVKFEGFELPMMYNKAAVSKYDELTRYVPRVKEEKPSIFREAAKASEKKKHEKAEDKEAPAKKAKK